MPESDRGGYARALSRNREGLDLQVESAGLEPKGVHPLAVRVMGSEEEVLQVFRSVRDEIRARVIHLLQELETNLDSPSSPPNPEESGRPEA